MEKWRDIPGYEGAYQASNLGRVRSLPREVPRFSKDGAIKALVRYKGKVLSSWAKDCGHHNVLLGANNTQLVHRLVLLAFVGPPEPGQECRHLNGNPADNRLENLTWGSRLENRADISKHARLYGRRQGSTWLSEDVIRAIKRDLQLPDRPSQKVLARKYGVHYNTINNINRGFTHKWVSI
jgi:hypothetical protein